MAPYCVSHTAYVLPTNLDPLDTSFSCETIKGLTHSHTVTHFDGSGKEAF